MKAPQLVGDTGSLAGTKVDLSKPRVVVGRDKASCDFVLSQPFISKCHAAFDTDESGTTTVRDLGSKYGTYVNGDRVVERSLSDGDSLGFGPSGVIAFTYSANGESTAETVLREAVPRSASFAAVAEPDRVGSARDLPETDGSETVRIATASVLNIGRAPDNEIVLNAAGVSRHHARLTIGKDSPPVLVDVGSTNGTYVNGELLREPRYLDPSDVIFLGGFLFTVDGRSIRQIDLSASRICALGLSKEIKGEVVMSDISLAVLPGEFVGIMGPSGCGKSTLMDALDGLQPAPVGSVFLGNLELYRNFNSVRRSIGHVPQHDILHDDLTVERTLLYAAHLRLPETASGSNIARVVSTVVDVVNLRHKLATPFRNLSGGEQKRLSIAIELITEPNFLFLDEPTSPLDPETTEDLMDRFRKLADQGRIVIMITHKFEKFQSMDQVAILAKGGHLAFFGPPEAALEYFSAKEPADIFRRMHQKTPDELSRQFRSSPQYHKYVHRRVVESRALTHDSQSGGHARVAAPAKTSFQAELAQWWTLTQRFFEIKLKDRRNTALLLVQSPIIAMILVLISGDTKNDPKTLFIAAVIAVWFGANNAIREIVAEFPIYKRERRFSLRIPPYVLSKFAVLSVIGLVQAVTFVAILTAKHLLEWNDFTGVLSIFFLTTLGGISMALFFSAIVNSAEKALSILPLLLIPQLLLSGFLKPVETIYVSRNGPVSAAVYDRSRAAGTSQIGAEPIEGLGGARLLSGLVLARWSIDGLAHVVSLDDDVTRDRLASHLYVASYATVFDNNPESTVVAAYHRRTWLDLAILMAFSIGFLPLTMWALKRRDIL